jgi:hypothetical protein
MYNVTICTICTILKSNLVQSLCKIVLINKKLLNESDCKVITEIYLKYGIESTCLKLLGEFAFMILDINEESRRHVIFEGT